MVILCCACTAGPTTVGPSTPSFLYCLKVTVVRYNEFLSL
ncbi:unnamed protein product [Tetraodon nigroviridis]|uniref:(spotted green pufferfish) hypothetical protein n=1 Tax=Tetraodon nigroviridis TaxID=99883 RepID=Q4SZ49_TETNG|nr:unnamed protein product [Tetraodon nigroviridis]